jgi:hypothetical protein
MSPTILRTFSSHTARELIKQPVISVPDPKEKTEYLKYTCKKSSCTAYSRCAECQEEENHGFIYQGGDHLYYTVELDFEKALTGWERTITNIEKKLIIIENEGTMQHGSKPVSPNLGVPQGRTPIQR